MSDSKELATGGGREIAAAKPPTDIAQMLSMARELALNPDIDAEKFKTIMDITNGAIDRLEKKEFYTAKAAAIFEMPVIRKDGKIVIEKQGQAPRIQGTFAKWPDLQRAITPILFKHDLFITHDIGHEGPVVTVTPVLQHRNGYVERGKEMILPLDSSGGKNNTQGAGSASSYGKRYSTIAMLGIRLQESDDDGLLTALPDEPLNDQQARIAALAEARGAEGAEQYGKWFETLTPKDKAWLVQTGRHHTFGGAQAMPGAKPRPAADPAPASGKRPTQDLTPEEKLEKAKVWLSKYENRVNAATDSVALDDAEAWGKAGREALRGEFPALFREAERFVTNRKIDLDSGPSRDNNSLFED